MHFASHSEAEAYRDYTEDPETREALLRAAQADAAIVRALKQTKDLITRDELTTEITPPTDSDALADAINQLLNQPHRRTELGNKAKTRVAHKFTVEEMVKRTFHLYQHIMNGQADGKLRA